jgi:hypothetical protein
MCPTTAVLWTQQPLDRHQDHDHPIDTGLRLHKILLARAQRSTTL